MSVFSNLSPRQLAIQAELADTRSWMDLYAAAPRHVANALGLASEWQGPLALVHSQIPFSHFNMVLTLGCPAPADDATFDAIDAFYAQGGCGRHWIVVNDHSEPTDLGARLLMRGYKSAGAWDRVILQGARPELWRARADGCEPVTPANAEEWSAFIRQCYGMPPIIADWLLALVGRNGWSHMLRREDGRAGGKVVMARSLNAAGDGWCWLGIDAPVPGVMAPCFDDDQEVTAALLLAASPGASSFVSDIELTSIERAGPAYRGWEELGFSVVYRRSLYVNG